jgi:hypothetical protein
MFRVLYFSSGRDQEGSNRALIQIKGPGRRGRTWPFVSGFEECFSSKFNITLRSKDFQPGQQLFYKIFFFSGQVFKISDLRNWESITHLFVISSEARDLLRFLVACQLLGMTKQGLFFSRHLALAAIP